MTTGSFSTPLRARSFLMPCWRRRGGSQSAGGARGGGQREQRLPSTMCRISWTSTMREAEEVVEEEEEGAGGSGGAESPGRVCKARPPSGGLGRGAVCQLLRGVW